MPPKGVIPLPLLGISLTPVGTKSASFSSAVTGAVHTIEERGLKYQITPTQTIIEGELDQLMDVAKEIHENAMAGTTRVITNITIIPLLHKVLLETTTNKSWH